MIPSWLIHVVTLAMLAVGFGMGYRFKGWKQRVDAQADLMGKSSAEVHFTHLAPAALQPARPLHRPDFTGRSGWAAR